MNSAKFRIVRRTDLGGLNLLLLLFIFRKLSRICYFYASDKFFQQITKAMLYRSVASGAYTSVRVLQAYRMGDGFCFNN
jgi:hypothetical protein